MNLKQYLSEERGRQSALAKLLGAHAPDVSRWADGTRPIPLHFAAQIEVATLGAVTRQEMFPNDWYRLWPELAVADHRRATDQAPAAGHGGRQPASPSNILDTASGAVVVVSAQPAGEKA